MFLYSVISFFITRVQIGRFEHLLPIIGTFVFGVLLIKYVKDNCNKGQRLLWFKGLSIFVSLTVISFHLHKLFFDSYQLATDLPLYLCSFLALIIPVFAFYRKYWMYEILVFWIVGGTLQGVVTPDIEVGFPSFDYFRYWVVHLGLLVIIFYATFVFNYRPKLKSVFKSILAFQGYLLLIFGINYLLNANYCYLNEKPKSASLLDYLGDWPQYLLVVELMLMPYFLLIYLPFYLYSKKQSQ